MVIANLNNLFILKDEEFAIFFYLLHLIYLDEKIGIRLINDDDSSSSPYDDESQDKVDEIENSENIDYYEMPETKDIKDNPETSNTPPNKNASLDKNLNIDSIRHSPLEPSPNKPVQYLSVLNFGQLGFPNRKPRGSFNYNNIERPQMVVDRMDSIKSMGSK